MIDAVLSLWRMGMDTRRMATVLQARESDCERWLHEGLEIERRRNAGPGEEYANLLPLR